MSSNKPMSSSVNRQIDDNIRRVYQQAVEEELPDRLKDLLAQLRDKDKPASGDQGDLA